MLDILIIAIVIVLGFGVKAYTGFKEAREERKNERLFAAFDKATTQLAGYVFPKKTLVLKEHINNYATYTDSNYVANKRRLFMYSTIADFLDLDANDKKDEIRYQEGLVTELESADRGSGKRVAIEKECLELMRGAAGKERDAVLTHIAKEMRRVSDEITRMETASSGWRYIFEGTTSDNVTFRFVYVAEENAPEELYMVGGAAL